MKVLSIKAALLLIISLICVCLLSCRAGRDEEKIMTVGERLHLQEEERETAAKYYRRLMNKYGSEKMAARALLDSAVAQTAVGRYSLACAMNQYVINQRPGAEIEARGALQLARCYYAVGAADQAYDTARRVIDGPYRDHCRLDQLFMLLGDSLVSLGKSNSALSYYLIALDYTENQDAAKAVEQRIFSEVLSAYRDADILRLQEIIGQERFSVMSNIYLGVKFKNQMRIKESAHHLALALSLQNEVPCSMYPEARKALDNILAMRPAVKNRIGLLLPFSGPGAVFGEEVLKGVLLGAKAFKHESEAEETEEVYGPEVELVVRDTGGDAKKVVEAFEELVLEERVNAVIGPLFTKESEALCAVANPFQTPIFCLSQNDEVAEAGDYIYKIGISQHNIISSLLSYSIGVLGLERFVVFYPQDAYGVELSRIFIETAALNGGEIMALISYDPNQTDFTDDIKKIKEVSRPKTDAEILEEQQERELMGFSSYAEFKKISKADEENRVLNFDALFIPDYYRNLAILTPQLLYYDIKEITLLGSNGWNNPYLFDQSGRYIRGAIFGDEFFADSNKVQVVEFVDSFRELIGSEPMTVNAQGYEAVQFLQQIMSAGVSDRDGIKRYLLSSRELQGIGGPVTINSKGIAWRRPFIITGASRGFKEVADE